METLLTESMIGCAILLRTAGNFRQNGTQLELIEYHARCRSHGHQALVAHGSTRVADTSSKCETLRVARVAWRARTIPAIIVSRSSRGRPFSFREAIKALACSADSTSNGAMRPSISTKRLSNPRAYTSRRFPRGMTCNPKRISNTVTEVVQI